MGNSFGNSAPSSEVSLVHLTYQHWVGYILIEDKKNIPNDHKIFFKAKIKLKYQHFCKLTHLETPEN